MAPRPQIQLLPADVLDALNAKLVEQSFSNYEGLSAWLQDQGFQISKTAVWKHGSTLQAAMEKSINRARERMEIAKALGGASDDDKAALMEANEMVAMDQIMDMFDSVAGLEVNDRMKAVPSLVRAIADLNRSAVGSAKWRKEFDEALRTAQLDVLKKLSEFISSKFPDYKEIFAKILTPFADWLVNNGKS